MNEIVKIKPRKTTESFKQEVFDLVKNEYVVESDYLSCDEEITFRHNIKTCNRTFLLTPHTFKQGRRCPFCANRKLYVGFNDLNTLRPDMSKYLHNYEDGFKVHVGSGKKIDWECPYCKCVFSRSVSDMLKRGFSCSKCSDNISYPNKFMYNILLQINNLDFLKREFRPKWCKFILNGRETFGIYDIYFGYKNKEYFIELDGGIGHGNKILDKTQKESLFIDSEKDRLAKEHNIEIIRIDCNYGSCVRFDFIKNNILQSQLNNIFELNCIDFNKADLESLCSYIILAANYWNNGFTIKEISEKMDLYSDTITRYLKQCNKLGLCDYSKEEAKNRATATKIYCLTTNEIFDTITSGAEKYNTNASGIGKCCRGMQGYSGEYNGEKLKWMYYHDYLKLKESGKEYKERQNNNFTKVVCITTGITYDSIKDAAIDSNCRESGIQACCCGRYKYSGTDKLTGDKLIWMYYKDYIKLNNKNNLEE